MTTAGNTQCSLAAETNVKTSIIAPERAGAIDCGTAVRAGVPGDIGERARRINPATVGNIENAIAIVANVEKGIVSPSRARAIDGCGSIRSEVVAKITCTVSYLAAQYGRFPRATIRGNADATDERLASLHFLSSQIHPQRLPEKRGRARP